MARPPSDSTPDSSPPPDDDSAPPDHDHDDDLDASPPDAASPPSDPPPASKARPPFPERINTIDIMPGTLIGAHLPPLLEELAAKRAAQGSQESQTLLGAPPPPPAALEPAPAKHSDAAHETENDGAHEPWRSPLERRPAWLIALASVPRRVWAIAAGGLVAGLLLVTGARGCVGKSRIDDLENRVGTLERAVGVNADAGISAGMNASGEPAAANANAPATSGDKSAAPLVTSTADDTKKKNCAFMKLTAYQAWQGAADKAKTLAAPAEAKCASLWTDAKKQACYGAATQTIRSAESARNATIKGGAAARDAVKKVKDDPANDAIGKARAASSAAFDACQDENEL